MKTCIVCGEMKDYSEFTMRKKPPIKPYAACKSCEPIAYKRKPTGGYKDEVRELRAKAVELRAFTPEQDVEIARRVKAGEFKNAIAREFGVADSTIASAEKRGRTGLDKA